MVRIGKEPVCLAGSTILSGGVLEMLAGHTLLCLEGAACACTRPTVKMKCYQFRLFSSFGMLNFDNFKS